MADRQFRLRTVTFDDREDVDEVSAAVTLAARDTITGLIGEVETLPVAESAAKFGETVIVLPAADARKLFHAAGQSRGTDPGASILHEAYDSLSAVFYGLMGEDG